MYRVFSRDVTKFKIFPRKLPPPCWCPFVAYKISCDLRSFTLQKMSKEKDDAPQLSEYANTLDPLVKKRYMQKIACIGVDPFHAKNTMPNVFLPPSRLTSFPILFLKPVTTLRSNLRPLKAFKHTTS